MRVYIARDKDWDLNMFGSYPVDNSGVWDEQLFIPAESQANGRISIDSNLYPEITYENSPVEVELNIKLK